MGGEYAIEMVGITKAFPGVLANDRIDLRVKANTIHALLGENGAGKSTLMSILFGLYRPDAGIVRVRGSDVDIRDPNDATALRIGIVHQHFKLVRAFTAAENVALGSEPRSKSGAFDLKAAEARVAELSARYGLDVDPRARVSSMSVGAQQRLEILKLLYRNADILILDEPTAVLRPQEVDELLEVLGRLKSEGKTIILITHKLREIRAAAERCTILRRGRVAGDVDVAGTTEAELASLMVGREVDFSVDKRPAAPGDVVLRVDNLVVTDDRGSERVRGLSLEVRSGEIVGVAGVDGNGQTELVEAIVGLRPAKSGRVLLGTRDITKEGVRARIGLGVGHVPEDRRKHGLVAEFRLDENLALKSFREAPYSNRLGFVDRAATAAKAAALIERFDIRAGEGPATVAGSMSGGNQQKAILAREIDRKPKLLVVAQPTRGLDVGAIEYVHERIVAERDAGAAVLLVSFELDEVLALCDRIAAISRGAIVGVVEGAGADERRIGAMMAGSVDPGATAGAGAGTGAEKGGSL